MGSDNLKAERYLAPEVVTDLKRNNSAPSHRLLDFFTRIVDVVCSAVGLVLVSPLLLLVAIVIKSHDRGPVFFYQERLGWHGEAFSILKFRTMVVNAEQQGSKLRSTKDDPRITPIGRILREYHVDEIPQIINVLRGQMSLVGPRPALLFHKDYYEPWEMKRLAIRPGMTGLSQVSGGNGLNWDDRIKMDVYYVHHHSLSMYIKILWQTFAQLFVKKGIYGKDGVVKGWTRPVPDWYYDNTMGKNDCGPEPEKSGGTPGARKG